MPDLNTTKRQSKKRKAADLEAEDDRVESTIEDFEHEDKLRPYYTGEQGAQRIILEDIPEVAKKPFYVTMDTKEITAKLDLKKEVVLTMLN